MLVNLAGVALNAILFAMGVYMLLFMEPLNVIALMSAVLCPIATTLKYRGVKFGRWLCILNGLYLLVFYSSPLILLLLGRVPLSSPPRDLPMAVLGTISSTLLLIHCAVIDGSPS